MASRRDKRSDETSSTDDTTWTAEAGASSSASTAASGTVLPDLAPPSDEEAKRYYRRLPSSPRLVGRTSGKERWQAVVPGTRVVPQCEQIDTVGQHTIVQMWEGGLAARVMSIVQNLPWTSVDVVRIGLKSAKRSEKPVILWVGVSTADVPWEQVADVLRALRAVLDVRGLDDVDVEVRVASVSGAAGTTGPALLPANVQTVYDVDRLRQLYTTAIGQSFASEKTDGIRGTLGMYLWAARAGNSTDLFALTCRHVALPEKGFPGNRPVRRRFASQPANKMIIPASDTVAAWQVDLQDIIAARKAGLQAVREDRNARPGAVQAQEYMLDEAMEWSRTVDSLVPIGNRIVGEVAFSPPIGPAYPDNNTGRLPWTRDWCLVRMDPGKFPGQAMPQNTVDLRTPTWSKAQMTALLNPHPRSIHKFVFPESGLLPLSGVIPMAELHRPNMVDKNGEECIVVGKRGSSSGLTFGTANEIESIVRRYQGLQAFTSREWLVVGFDRANGFSEAGDSGSVIFDIYGRAGGLITGGSLLEFTTNDVTYATPMAQLLPDISEHVGYEVMV